MKKVLLINPWIYDFSAFDLWLKPLGLLYIASFLEKRGFEVSLLDCLDRFHPAMLREEIKPVKRKYGTGKFYSEEIEKPAAIKSVPRRYKRFGIPYEKLPYVSMLTSLGCPFHCTYCVSNLLVKRFFMIKKEKVINEIDTYVQKLKVKDIAFYDDALLYNQDEHFLPLFEEVLKRKFKVRFHTPNGVNARFITKDVAELLFTCNFKTIRIGLESCQTDFLKGTGGKVTCEEISQAVSNLTMAGIPKENIGIYIMAGRDDEKIEDVIETLRFVAHLGTRVFVSEYSPVPGSRDWDRSGNFKKLDPLWQNNSIAFVKNGWGFEEIQRVKDIKDLINYAATKHIDLSSFLD